MVLGVRIVASGIIDLSVPIARQIDVQPELIAVRYLISVDEGGDLVRDVIIHAQIGRRAAGRIIRVESGNGDREDVVLDRLDGLADVLLDGGVAVETSRVERKNRV